MITLSASGGSVTFTFSGNSTYLNDGQITVPVNSLALIIDESDMATFRKAASNDIFVSANIAEFGMTKAELESWYKENAVGSTGGGKAIEAGRGISITTGETADTVSFNLPISAITSNNSIMENYSGNFAIGSYSHAEGFSTSAIESGSHAEGGYTSASGELSHAEGYYTSANNQSEHASGQYNISSTESVNFGHSGNTLFSVGNGTDNDARHNAFEIRQNGDIYFEYDGADTKLQDKLDEIETVTAAAFNELNEAVSGKQNTLSAGRGISISSNTISFDLPISAGTGSDSIVEGHSSNVASGEYSHAEGYSTSASGKASHAEGNYSSASGHLSHAEGSNTIASGYASHAEGYSTSASGYASHAEGYYTSAIDYNSHAEGYSTSASGNASHAEGSETSASGNYSHAEGYNTVTYNDSEHASGQYNVSSSAISEFGDSRNTLFSVGNGTADDARHNAFEIRQNGDIYFEYDGNNIKLQDKLDDIESVTAAAINNLNDKFGGLKLQQITQSAYDQLQTKDPNVLYVIVN